LTIVQGMGLADVAAGLARLVNGNSDQAAVAEGNRVIVASLVGAAAGAPVLSVTPANRIDTSSATVAISRTLLAGSVAPGDVWTVGLKVADQAQPVRFSFTAASTTLADVATGLAAAINAAAGDSYLATASGSELLVVNASGAAFTVSLSAAPAALSVSRNFDVSGAVAALDLWKLTLSVGGIDTTVSFTSAGSSLSALATGLAQAIDTLAGFTARASGSVLTISTEGVNAGRPFTLSTVARAGTVTESVTTASRDLQLWGPVVAGDLWRLQLTVGGVLHTLEVPVASTLAQLQTDLLAAIDGLDNFRADVVGGLVRVATDGTADGLGFGLTYTVERGFASTLSTSVASATIGQAQGRPVAGEVWQITVGATPLSHTVLAGQTLGDVLAALAAQVNGVNPPSTLDAVVRGITIVVAGSASFSVPAAQPPGRRCCPGGGWFGVDRQHTAGRRQRHRESGQQPPCRAGPRHHTAGRTGRCAGRPHPCTGQQFRGQCRWKHPGGHRVRRGRHGPGAGDQLVRHDQCQRHTHGGRRDHPFPAVGHRAHRRDLDGRPGRQQCGLHRRVAGGDCRAPGPFDQHHRIRGARRCHCAGAVGRRGVDGACHAGRQPVRGDLHRAGG
jgi:hypothetical protein